MTTKSNFSTLQAYVDYLNSLLNQIITDSRLTVLNASELQSLVTCFQNSSIQPLKLKPKGWLHFRQQTCIKNGRVIVERCRYAYSLSSNPDNEDSWIFRYEYRLIPDEIYVPHAHLHVNAQRNGKTLKHIHFPTSRLSIEQVIAHLIIEHKIKPKCSDWFDCLAKSHEGFAIRRTDPHQKLFP